MAHRGAGWSANANNPNLTPLPPRPGRPGIGAPGAPPGPPPQLHQQQYMSPPPVGSGGMPMSMPMSMPGPPNGGPYAYAPPSGNGIPTGPGWGGPPPGPAPGGPPGAPPILGQSMTPPAAVPLGAPEPATTLFIGAIAAGVTDVWLTRLLEASLFPPVSMSAACGNLRQLKRPNKAFGFAEFSDPPSVKRALKILNGLELPAFESGAPSKKLNVKGDDKTRKYMDGWENDRIVTDEDEANDSEALARVKSIVKRMQDPTARNEGADSSTPAYEIPAHLKDLTSEELPEEHRGSVLSEIDKFRQAAAAREEEARKKEIELEKQRQRAREERERGGRASSSSYGRDERNGGHHHAPGAGPSRFGPGQDPQSYNRPLNFVSERGNHAEPVAAADEFSNLDPEERDEAEERRRRKNKEADDARTFRDAEHRALGRERARISHWERELAKEKADEERRRRDRDSLLRFYETWSEEEALDKEMFYYDRSRWRHHRRAFRKREEEKDARDEEAEATAAAAAAAEAERFLAQQAAEMAALQERQRAAGILIPASGTGGIRLNIAAKKEGGAGGATGAAGGATAASGGGSGMKISIGLKKGGIGASLVAAAGGAGSGPGTDGHGGGAGGGFQPLVRTSVLGDADEDDGLRKRKLRKIVLDDDEGAPPTSKRR
ncbi:hypothetical protein OC834_004390 [Tilletia horrida]|nr:hypothetical protein OC834_004390 [Tilletia horrida]